MTRVSKRRNDDERQARVFVQRLCGAGRLGYRMLFASCGLALILAAIFEVATGAQRQWLGVVVASTLGTALTAGALFPLIRAVALRMKGDRS